eukprot:Polyplicarium_translucidae@DN1008_c0_g1_i1.p1
MRKLKYHEQKLLKKVDFFNWKGVDSAREATTVRRFCIEDRTELHKYNKLSRDVALLATFLRALPSDDAVRIRTTQGILKKLYQMGVISSTSSLEAIARLSPAAFCRRRLAVTVARLKFSPSVSEAVKLVQHGHIRVGSEVVTDPAFHVNRAVEDSVQWAGGSAYKTHVETFKGTLDDFDLLQL